VCGNGMIEGSEACDGADLGGNSCQTLGFAAGTLVCQANCALDTTGCTNIVCGNGAIESGEQCDSGNLGGATCQTFGFDSGTLSCSACSYDTSSCVNLPTCAHNKCTQGGPLTSGCESCVTTVCSIDSYCCSTAWDTTCVYEVDDYCGFGLCSTCAHDECVTGSPLTTTCDACAAAICADDPFCCQLSWDSTCVSEKTTYCGGTCP
jgi:hypothetical protein